MLVRCQNSWRCNHGGPARGVLIYWQERRGRETFRDEETQEAREHGSWSYLGLDVLFTISNQNR